MIQVASQHNTDCIHFEWKYSNYDRMFLVPTYYNAGNSMYTPNCLQPDTTWMFLRPIDSPCEGCPYYEAGTEKGRQPPTTPP